MGADGMPQGFDPDAFAQAFGGAGGFRGGNVHVSGDFSDLGDIFSSLFGGNVGNAGNPFGGARVRTRAPRGNDLVGRLEVSFAEAALGTRRTVRSGSGGQLEVQVPPGVDTGGRLRLIGHGGAAPKGGQPGDLHLEIVVTPDAHLRRSGDDIEVDLPLSVGEAILGTKVNVPTVDGAVLLTIPPGTSSGAKLRLRGKGIKRSDGSRGDQIGHVQIVVPKIAAEDTETRKLAEELDQRTKGTKVRDF
jgi:DnaJ-class molecular chaperone